MWDAPFPSQHSGCSHASYVVRGFEAGEVARVHNAVEWKPRLGVTRAGFWLLYIL